MIALWVSTAFLKEGRYTFGSLITAIPAAFMTAVSTTYILIADEGFCLGQNVSYAVGNAAVIVVSVIYVALLHRNIRIRRGELS